MRGAAVLFSCCLLAVACTGALPTSSPVPTDNASPSATAGATATASATANPSPTITIGPDGLPTSVLGLPVLTVAAAQALVDSGAADGRFMAVGGYWYSYFLPCAFQPHIAPLADHCGYGVLTDDARNPDTGQGPGFSPAMVTESAASFSAAADGSQIVTIVHVADDRLWQCAADQRVDCTSRPVLDRMVWAVGQEIDPAQFQPNPQLATSITFDQASAAASTAAGGGQVVLAYPLEATTLNDVDPRLIGQASNIVWYARIISGAPDAGGTAPGTDVLLDDATGTVVTTHPLDVDLNVQPARLVLDANGFQGNGQPGYTVSLGDVIVANESLDSQSTPLVLGAGDYTVRAVIVTPLANPVAGPTCDMPLQLASGDDVAYYADYTQSGCTWKQGSFPFN